MKNIRNFVVLFSILAAALAANALDTFHGTFRLTSEVRWGKTVLPAGEYTLIISSLDSPVVIQSVDGKAFAIVAAQSVNDPAPGASYIFVTGTGNDRQVRSMNLPQLGRSLVFKPLTQRERETLYASVSQTIPVQVARK